MGKKATKAADNMYYLARCEAAETNADFSSREKAAELVGIDRTRLARIELDTIVPYPEEVKAMAKAYNTPELNNSFCARECPLGRSSVSEVDIVDFDRLALKVSPRKSSDQRRGIKTSHGLKVQSKGSAAKLHQQ